MNKAFFSPGTECLDAIIELIRSSFRSLDICVFTISDDRITREILYKYQQGVPIRLITDNDKCYDTGSDIELLASKGVNVRVDKTSYHMHHKFLVADKERVLTGSYNWTRSAAQYNHENILITSEKEVVNDFQKEFDRLWVEMEVY